MRQETLTQLRRHLKAVLSRRPGQALWLWGEPGVGKTFTTQGLLQETPCQSLSLHAALPDRALVLSLPRPPKRPAWSEAQRQRLVHDQHVPLATLVDTLAATLSALAPFVLHLEDLHEASPARLELIQKLAQVIPRLRGVGLLVTSRSEPLEPFKGYRLGPLSQEESVRLLRAEAGGELPQEGLEWVFARAQGNPLFTLEFWRYLCRQGFFWSDGQIWHWKKPSDGFVPVSLEALIARLAHELDPTGQAVLEARALFPMALEPERSLWIKVAGVEPAAFTQALSLLASKGLLHGQGFAHPLIREVVEREIPAGRKRGYALRAVRSLEEHPEAAAEFIEMAGLESREALELLERATALAQARSDPAAEARWLSAAVQWSSGADRARRALKAAWALSGIQPVQAIQMAEVAASASPPDPEAVLLLVELLALEGRVPEAEKWLGVLPEPQERSLRWWESRIWVANRKGFWRESIELWNQWPQYHAKASVRIRRLVGSSYAYLNQLDQAQRFADELSTLPDLSPVDEVAVLNLCAQIQLYRGNHQAVLELEERYLSLARRAGLHKALLWGLVNHASTCEALGLREQARCSLEEARALALKLGDIRAYALVQLRLADRLSEDGAYERAESLCLEAHPLLQESVQWKTEGHLKLARLYLNWQPPHGPILAHKHAQAARELAQESQDAKFLAASLAYLSRAHAQLGHPQEALEAAQACLELCAAKGISTKQAEAWFAYGLALEAGGRTAEALEALEKAALLQRERKLAERFALEADRIRGDLERARERHAWFISQGLRGLAGLAQRYFPALAEAPQAPRPQSGLILKVLGPVELEQDGKPIAYRGRKRLELLCYLLEARIAGRTEVSGLELCDSFYPGVEEAKARATLKQQVHLIRMTLGPETIHSTPGGYALGALRSDAEEFLKSGDARLWRGPYLEHLSEGWHGGVREALIQALYTRAVASLEGEPKEAFRLAQVLLGMEPYDTGFLQLSLQALRRSGSPKAATRLYKEAQERFLEVGEALPGLEALLQASPPPA